MQKKERSRLKRIGIDIIGFLLIIAAALTGWLPGPGGIPLLIIGLSLLATNHEWAERLLNKVKDNTGKLGEKIFSKNPRARWAIDIAAIAIIAGAVLLMMTVTRSILKTAAISLILVAIILLLGNRERYQSLKGRFKKSKP